MSDKLVDEHKTIPQQFEELKIKLMRTEEQIKCLREAMLGVLEDQKIMRTSIRMLHDSITRMNNERIKAIEQELGTKTAEPAKTWGWNEPPW